MITIHLTAWQAAAIVLVVAADVLVAVRTWRRARRSERSLAMVRQLAEDHVGYVPDDLLRSPKRDAFERASRYWSNMVLREIDHPDPNAMPPRRRG